MEKKYIIKTPYNAYVGLHSNGEELNLLMVKTDQAPRYTLPEVKAMKTKFETAWERNSLQVSELVTIEKPVTGIY